MSFDVCGHHNGRQVSIFLKKGSRYGGVRDARVHHLNDRRILRYAAVKAADSNLRNNLRYGSYGRRSGPFGCQESGNCKNRGGNQRSGARFDEPAGGKNCRLLDWAGRIVAALSGRYRQGKTNPADF